MGNNIDHWYEEDEEVFVHPRDPYHRVDVLKSSRHVKIRVDGEVVAETDRPRILFETGLPPRYYFPLRKSLRMYCSLATRKRNVPTRWIWKWTARRSSGRSGRSELRSRLTLLCRRCGERILAPCWQLSVFIRVSHRGRIGPWCRRRRERIGEREEMLRETGMAEVNGARIYYEVAGEGDPLILLHAGIADSRMWEGQLMAFADRYRVIRLICE